MKSIQAGDPAPEFEAITSDGRSISLAEFKGKQSIVVFFYPRDDSPLCTQEACSFRDSYEEFVKLGAAVIGISGDSDEKHRAFATKHRLPYFMIADQGGALRRLFGVPNTMFVIPGRVTYVIDKQGIVRHIFNSQLSGTRHIDEALGTLRNLSESVPATTK